MASKKWPEIGVTGLRRSGGIVYEEFLTELRGLRGLKVYREMMDNSAAVGAALGAIEMLCRQVSWTVEPPPSPDQEDLRRTALVETARHDMSFSWADTLGEMLSMLGYGFSAHEIVYKQRGGDVNDPTMRSKFNDNLIAWRKLPVRAQETIVHWDLDENGGIQGFCQQASPDFTLRQIPIEKALLFRPRIARNNPEGRSILRTAYASYYFVKSIMRHEGIGIERDLAGLPVMGIPAACMTENATPDQRQTYEAAKTLVTGLRRDELEGVVIPIEYQMGTNNPMYKLELLTTGGRRQFDTSAIIERYDRRIVMTMLYDLLLMGQPNTITYKGGKMPEFFAVSLGAWLDSVADPFNTYAIPGLYRLNGWPTDRCCSLKHGDVDVPDLAALGDYIAKIAPIGALDIDAGLKTHLRRVANLPDATGPQSVGPAGGPDDEEDGPASGPDDDDDDEEDANPGAAPTNTFPRKPIAERK